MANLVFNVALGRVAEKVADGATLKLLLLRTAATGGDAAYKDATTVAALLALPASPRRILQTTRVKRWPIWSCRSITPPMRSVSIATMWSTHRLAVQRNNHTVDAVIYEEVAGGDANCIPLVLLDCVFTTDGNNVTLQMDAAGFFGAS